MAAWRVARFINRFNLDNFFIEDPEHRAHAAKYRDQWINWDISLNKAAIVGETAIN